MVEGASTLVALTVGLGLVMYQHMIPQVVWLTKPLITN